MSQPNRVALVAKMHSGKTEVARRLVGDYGFTRFALADGVKDATVDMVNAFLKHIGCEPTFTREELEKNKSTLRWLMQGVGTDLGRNYFGPDSMWIDFFRAKIEAHDGPIVCDDCRFPNEAEALREMGFKIVKLERPEADRLRSIRNGLFNDVIEQYRGTPNRPSDEDIFVDVDAKMDVMLTHASETNVELIKPHITLTNLNLTSLATIATFLARKPTPPPTAVSA